MKYWFIHLILIGVLVSIWIPATMAPSRQKSVEAQQKYQEREAARDSVIFEYEHRDASEYEETEPVPYDDEVVEELPPSAAGSSVEEKSTLATITSNLKELGSLIIMFGNILTFFWQWQDRKRRNSTD